MTTYTMLTTPLGELLLTGTAAGLTGLYMPPHRHAPELQPGWVRDDDLFTEVRAQLHAYFTGELTSFDVPLAAVGTPFQQRVWAALAEIPYGATRSYGQIAARIGAPAASRAVGLANGRNPISIIVPCHRVVGSTGKLVGYGAGVNRKSWLLALERTGVPDVPAPPVPPMPPVRPIRSMPPVAEPAAGRR